MNEFARSLVERVAGRLRDANDRLGRAVGVDLRHWARFLGPRRILAGVVGVVVAGLAGWWLLRPAAVPVEVQLPVVTVTESVVSPATDVPSASGTTVPGRLRVHVAGAVRRPGVYTLDAGARVVDAVRAAGGATDSADLERINLAQTVLDTEQVMVPRKVSSRPRVTVAPRHVPRPPGTTTLPPSTSTEGEVVAPTQVGSTVNLNTAGVDQLDTLPGIGPATAKAIVAHRTRKGPFSRVEDLLAIDGIGPKKLDAIRDLVSL